MSRIVFLQCQVICFRTSLQQSMLISTRATIKKVRNPEDPHRYYKWGYKPLPVQTSLGNLYRTSCVSMSYICFLVYIRMFI